MSAALLLLGVSLACGVFGYALGTFDTCRRAFAAADTLGYDAERLYEMMSRRD